MRGLSLIYAYLVVVSLGIPTFIVLKNRAALSLSNIVIASFVIASLPIATYALLGLSGEFAEVIGSAVRLGLDAGMWGAFAGVVFWLLAIRKSEPSASGHR